jgi:nucleotide-binding universal stress UspA family protein
VQKAAELMIPALKLRRSAATNRQSEAAFKKVRDILKNVMTEEKVVIGNPAQVIAEEADREKADLIVMGSRGLSEALPWLCLHGGSRPHHGACDADPQRVHL